MHDKLYYHGIVACKYYDDRTSHVKASQRPEPVTDKVEELSTVLVPLVSNPLMMVWAVSLVNSAVLPFMPAVAAFAPANPSAQLVPLVTENVKA